MKEMAKDIKSNKDNQEDLKETKNKKKESCRFLFDMIGRLLSK